MSSYKQMNFKNINFLITCISAPTISYSPMGPRICQQNWGLDLQDEERNVATKQKSEAQIFFPSSSYKGEMKKCAVEVDKEVEDKLNMLKILILKQKSCDLVKERGDSLSDQQHIQGIKFTDTLPTFHMISSSSPKPLPVANQSNREAKEKRVGAYSKVERQHKIKKYKEKLKKWRKFHPINRNFEGRRRVAFEKIRHNGRFAKAI